MLKDASPLQGCFTLNAFRMLPSLSPGLHKCLYVLASFTIHSLAAMERGGKGEAKMKYERRHKRKRWKVEEKREQREERKLRRWHGRDREEWRENVSCGQSIIQKRKGRCIPGAALNMPAWHHLLMGHRLTCYHTPPHPLTHQLFLSSYTGSYQSSLVERVNNYFMTTLLCKLEGCLHKEKKGIF